MMMMMMMVMVMVMVMVMCNPHEDGVLPVDIPWVEKTRIWARSSSPTHLTITMILIKSQYFKMLIQSPPHQCRESPAPTQSRRNQAKTSPGSESGIRKGLLIISSGWYKYQSKKLLRNCIRFSIGTHLRYLVGFTGARVLKAHSVLIVTVPLPVVDVHPCNMLQQTCSKPTKVDRDARAIKHLDCSFPGLRGEHYSTK